MSRSRWGLVAGLILVLGSAPEVRAEPEELTSIRVRALNTLDRPEGLHLVVGIEHVTQDTRVWASYGRKEHAVRREGEEPCEAWVTATESALLSIAPVPRAAFYRTGEPSYIRILRGPRPRPQAVVHIDVGEALGSMEWRERTRPSGWSAVPQTDTLQADLEQLLAPGALAKWLGAETGWRSVNPQGAADLGWAAAAVPPTYGAWGPIERIDVTVEASVPAALTRLEVRVRRGPGRYGLRPGADWPVERVGPSVKAFPFASLVPIAATPSQHPPVLDVAVMPGYTETAYVLRVLPGGPSPVLQGFLGRRRAERAR